MRISNNKIFLINRKAIKRGLILASFSLKDNAEKLKNVNIFINKVGFPCINRYSKLSVLIFNLDAVASLVYSSIFTKMNLTVQIFFPSNSWSFYSKRRSIKYLKKLKAYI